MTECTFRDERRRLLNLARAEIRELAPYNAGLSLEAVRQRYAVSRIAKLGSNENPIGPAPGVIEAVTQAARECALYPDAECQTLRTALSERLDIAPERLVFGNGSEDLIAILARVFLDHGDEVVTMVPAFGLHTLYPQSMGARVIGVPITADGAIDVDGLLGAITPRTRLVMFSSPSNPVGSALSRAEIERLLAGLPPHLLLVFDEAYFEYGQLADDYPDVLALLEASRQPWVLLRTFSKAYSLAGFRVGYGIVSDPVLADLVDRVRTPFNVSRPAQAAAVAALEDQEHLTRSLANVATERARLSAALAAAGLRVYPSLGNFLFLALEREADAVGEALLSHGVIVKTWREPGFTHCLRVTVGSPADNALFFEALMQALDAPVRGSLADASH